MAAIFKTKNQVFAAKVEVTPGTDASPTVGANAVRVQNLNFGPDIQSIDPEEVTGSLDDAAPIFAGGSQRVSFDVGMRSAGTAGTAPDWGVCALGCGMSETLLAADVTGTATGGSVNTIVIEAADIGADHEFNGMVVELTGGTGYNASNPKANRRVVAATTDSTSTLTVYPNWAGASPSTDTTYAIRACALYRPISTGLDFLTLAAYQRSTTGGDARLSKSLYSAGNFSARLTPRQASTLSFQFQGSLQSPVDVSDPGAPTYSQTDAFPYIDAVTFLAGTSVCVNEVAFDLGGSVQLLECQNEVFGYEGADIASRRSTGNLTPALAHVATRDVFAALLAGTKSKFWTSYGPSLGKRVSIYMPQLQYTGEEIQDVNGFLYQNLPFRAVGSNAGLYICAW